MIQRFGWPSIFWFLAIISVVCLTMIFLFFPETARIIVGNGNESKTGLIVCRLPNSCLRRISQDDGAAYHRRRFPNPFACLLLLRNRNTFFTILVGSFFYTAFSCLGDSLSISLVPIYKLDALQAGLIYIPSGVGGMVAAVTIGKLSIHP